MRSFKVLSALLAYPDAEVIAHREELRAILATEGAVPPAERAGIGRLIDELGAGDLLDAQERYVGLFDRTRSLSLQLFEHVHGDSRDRGQAMVDLAALYRRHGMEIAAQELPGPTKPTQPTTTAPRRWTGPGKRCR
ncbi:MAG: nitrate reductase molybdenum cofactor assembly chaperone [Rhodospirillales bacterium]|nr:nitrate reductase molybdenum cofactor assembly chaperone [Rhodospirillales bacterium]